MSWTPATFLEISDGVTPSFLHNNLSADGDGRFAFGHGDRVQCTKRHGKQQSSNDFTLATKTGGADVMQVFWWRDVAKYSRPLLAVAMDTPATGEGTACLQIWDTRSGKGNRLFNVSLDSEDSTIVQFGRGLGSMVIADGSTILFVGLSTGEVCGFQVNRKGALERTCRLRCSSSAITAIAGDKMISSFIAASDEGGNLIVWMHTEHAWTVVYQHHVPDDDYCCSLALRGQILIAGYYSGKVAFHDLEERQVLAEIVSNSKGITSIDVHPSRDIFLVTGEDCRASILALPTSDGEALKVIFSVCLNAIISGGQFTCVRPDMPDITLLLWERSHLVQYEFIGSQNSP
jgi:WD40 repeat protein